MIRTRKQRTRKGIGSRQQANPFKGRSPPKNRPCWRDICTNFSFSSQSLEFERKIKCLIENGDSKGRRRAEVATKSSLDYGPSPVWSNGIREWRRREEGPRRRTAGGLFRLMSNISFFVESKSKMANVDYYGQSRHLFPLLPFLEEVPEIATGRLLSLILHSRKRHTKIVQNPLQMFFSCCPFFWGKLPKKYTSGLLVANAYPTF